MYPMEMHRKEISPFLQELRSLYGLRTVSILIGVVRIAARREGGTQLELTGGKACIA